MDCARMIPAVAVPLAHFDDTRGIERPWRVEAYGREVIPALRGTSATATA